MRVAEALDVQDKDSITLSRARVLWADWIVEEPTLAVVDDLSDLPDWTRAGHGTRDDVVRALVKIGSPGGGNDPLATSVVCWLLLPAALRIYSGLRGCGPDVAEDVAAQLWIAARDFDWRKDVRVALGIVRTTREAVQADYGIGRGAERADRVWLNRQLAKDDDLLLWDSGAVAGPADSSVGETSFDQVVSTLHDAVDSHIISADDGQLLLELVHDSDDVHAGLASIAAHAEAAAKRGVSERTVRRRVRHAVDRMAARSDELRPTA